MCEIIPISILEDNYIWLLKNNSHVVIVDPGEAEPVLLTLEKQQLTPVAILITHYHHDHINGICDITKKYNIPVYAPKKENIKGSTNLVCEKDVICFPQINIKINIYDVPGHTLGSIAYYNDKFLFSGDTLFSAGCGRLFEGSPEQMFNSLNKLKELPDETLVYCAHEYTKSNLQFAEIVEPDNKYIQKRTEQVNQLIKTNKPTIPVSLGMEKKTNPFLRCDQPNLIKAATDYAAFKLESPKDVFAIIRAWKDNF